jgi:hypothetical protein
MPVEVAFKTAETGHKTDCLLVDHIFSSALTSGKSAVIAT